MHQYRTGPFFYAGHALLVAGLLFLDWPPAYVFLGAAFELALGVLGNIVRTVIWPGGLTAVLATLFHLPTLLVAAIAVVSSAFWQVADDASANTTGWLGLLVFAATALLTAIQKFCGTSLRHARFLEDLDDRFRFEDGRDLFSPSQLALGPLVESWLSTIAFVASVLIAAMVAAVTASPAAGAAAMALLCMLRHVAIVHIVTRVYGGGRSQEAVFLASCSVRGRVVPR